MQFRVIFFPEWANGQEIQQYAKTETGDLNGSH